MNILMLLMIAVMAAGVFPLSLFLIRSMQHSAPKRGVSLDEDLARPEPRDDAFEWWEERRGHFNRALLITGIVTILLYYFIIQLGLGKYRFAYFQFNWWALVFQATVYMVYMGIANLLYNAGFILENIRQPEVPLDFRERTFRLIYWTGIVAPVLFLLGLAYF